MHIGDICYSCDHTTERRTMTIKNPRYVDKYAAQVMEIRSALANLAEFVETLPAPDDNENIPGMDYGNLRSIDQLHSLLGVAIGTVSEF